jgi:hypothetical protein
MPLILMRYVLEKSDYYERKIFAKKDRSVYQLVIFGLALGAVHKNAFEMNLRTI